MSQSICPLTHKEDREYPNAASLNVCRWHATRTERAVAELPALYTALQHRLNGTGQPQLSGLPSGSQTPGLNLNHRVVQCRTDMRNNLTAWTRVAVEERRMRTPADEMTSMAAFVVAQIDWYLSQPWAKQFVNDTLDDWTLARALNDPNPVRMIEVGPCPEPECDGQLTARIRPADSLLPHSVECDQSPRDDDGEPLHYWSADKWLTLGRKIRKVSA